MPHRRVRFTIVLLFAMLWGTVQAQAAFGFDDVAREAAALARAPYRAPSAAAPRLATLNYDDYRKIRFKPADSLWRDAQLPWQVQFFAAGGGFAHALRLDEVIDGKAQPLSIPGDAFDAPGIALPSVAPIAGLRLLNRFNDGKQWDEVIAFLGASYFRALGAGQRYGASARAIAVDTVGADPGKGEEFPVFTAFWLDRPAPGSTVATLTALLDGPRVAGAYRFTVRPGATTTVDVQARLYLRGPVAMLGIAPLSSMFLAGENQPPNGDFRPEVHDSDGLQVAFASGEWLWRPLSNPRGSFVTSFAARSPRGFGLLQRDRQFRSYEDLEAHYERRPSVWVEPLGDWGLGRVELLQFHTPDETHDNVAAYWVPDQLPAAGQPLDIAWRLHWAAADVARPPGAMALQTRSGHGWRGGPLRAGQRQLHIDFDDPVAAQATAAATAAIAAGKPGAMANAAPSPGSGPTITTPTIVGNSAGNSEAGGLAAATGNPAVVRNAASPVDAVATVEAVASANANVRGLRANVQPNTVRGGWRVTLDFERIDPRQAVELRAFLRRDGQAVSETWSYAIAAEP